MLHEQEFGKCLYDIGCHGFEDEGAKILGRVKFMLNENSSIEKEF